jgi:hypothetical protein
LTGIPFGFADVFSALQYVLLAADLLAEFHSSIRESIKRLQPISEELKDTLSNPRQRLNNEFYDSIISHAFGSEAPRPVFGNN